MADKFARERFQRVHKLELQYLRYLRGVANQVDHIVKGMAPTGMVGNLAELQQALRRYSDLLNPWAKSVANRMIADISRKNESAWIQLGKETGRILRKELQEAPTGEFLRQFLDDQVALITSLPVEAGRRVHELTIRSLSESTRAAEIREEILKTGKVTFSRAQLIARTEVSRASNGLTMVRAGHVGATHYIWRTSHDMDVRASHKKMEGKVIAFDDPPEVEPGKLYHAGMFPNCRCYIEPILPEE